MDLRDFFSLLTQNYVLLLVSILVTLVIFINGWTDAPNAIATVVSTKALSPKKAILLAAVFNFIGVFVMTLVNATVAQTLYKIADFGSNSSQALIALSAGMIGIILWASVAWYFGIPTSESHALIAGISGAAIALQNSFDGIQFSEWSKVLIGLLLSTLLGFGSGFLVTKGMMRVFRHADRNHTKNFFRFGQIGSGAMSAFMHGAQDGQKFLGVFLLAVALSQGQAMATTFTVPIFLMVWVSLVMGIGTSIGGYRIIKTVGMKMVKLEDYQAFSSDIATSTSLLFASLFGIPVSTTHMKTTAMMGTGAAKRVSSVRWGVVKDLVYTWLLTFPGCGLIGFLMVKLFLLIF